MLGPEHPDTLSRDVSLAMALAQQGKYAAAEVLYWRALAGQEKVLGSEHPDTLRSANDLAIIFAQRVSNLTKEKGSCLWRLRQWMKTWRQS